MRRPAFTHARRTNNVDARVEPFGGFVAIEDYPTLTESESMRAFAVAANRVKYASPALAAMLRSNLGFLRRDLSPARWGNGNALPFGVKMRSRARIAKTSASSKP